MRAATSTLGVRRNCFSCASVSGGMSYYSFPESSPAACRFAIRYNTSFCFLLSGLLNIDSALTLISFAGRDDAAGFFFAIFILHALYVDDQQHRPLYGSNGVPQLFARQDAILAEDCVGIVWFPR